MCTKTLGRRIFISSSNETPCYNVGFLDSGIGGLSILAEVAKTCPFQNYTYLADQKFFPYGDKPGEFLLTRLQSLVPDFIEHHSLDLLVIACNTASTSALASLRSIVGIPIIGVVPAIKPAAEQTSSRQIGILATPSTIDSQYTKNLIQTYASHCKVHLVGSSELVRFAELKAQGHPADDGIVLESLQLFIQNQVDIIVLACTHFPFLRSELGCQLPPNVRLIDSAQGIAKQVRRTLASLKVRNKVHLKKPLFISTSDTISPSELEAAFSYYIAKSSNLPQANS